MTELETRPPTWSADQADLLAAARAAVNRDRLAETLRRIVDIPSPTGEELALARHLAGELAAVGLESKVQPIAGERANAVGRYGGGDGPELLLYSAIDVAFSGDVEEDWPWTGRQPTPDLRVGGTIEGGKVIGMGAENPKSFAAVVLETVTALAATGAHVPGRVTAGFGAGGMPSSGRPGWPRQRIGHGIGCAWLLEREVHPDAAVIVKPGWSVSWEEVGLTWHTVTVHGVRNYTGIRHKTPYKNPILEARAVIDRLETWFADYAERHTSGLVSPQGSINAIRGGSGDLSAFIPETCELFLDVRVSPRSSPEAVQAELQAVLDELKTERGVDITTEMTVAVPGTHTPPESWIVQSAIRAWEEQEGRPHQIAPRTSGATDADILRGHGIPTARLGPPPASTPSPYPGFSMGVADVESLEKLVNTLLYVVVDTVTRTREDVGVHA
jgi:acetylornithine deacetylase/succinyl-diaminopimelate desuccinylase-like protein